VSAAREEILARIRAATADKGGGARRSATSDVPRAYRRRGQRPQEEVLSLFCRRVADYGAEVAAVSDAVAAATAVLASRGARRVGIAPDLPGELRPSGFELVEDRHLATSDLDRLDAALTTCEAACAETGTIALTGGAGQGRRALTLVPDVHVCVVLARDVVETVPELFDRLRPTTRLGRPIVLVSGPSATSDIELSRVEGVHGPRTLAVIVVGS
jgi:L-lactate dehydrogenase complex protein LldG